MRLVKRVRSGQIFRRGLHPANVETDQFSFEIVGTAGVNEMAEYGFVLAVQAEPFWGIEATVTLPQAFSACALRFPGGKDERIGNLNYYKSKNRPDLARFFYLDYFDAYLGIDSMASQRGAEDPLAEAGVYRYGDRDCWNYFLNTVVPKGERKDYSGQTKVATSGPTAPASPKPKVDPVGAQFAADMRKLLPLQAGLPQPLQAGKEGGHWFEQNVSGGLTTCRFKLLIDERQRISFYVNDVMIWQPGVSGRGLVSEPSRGFKVKACIGLDDRIGTVNFSDLTIGDIRVYKGPNEKKAVPIPPGHAHPISTGDSLHAPQGVADASHVIGRFGRPGRTRQDFLAEINKLVDRYST